MSSRFSKNAEKFNMHFFKSQLYLEDKKELFIILLLSDLHIFLPIKVFFFALTLLSLIYLKYIH